jgi:hypothetical protein
VRDECSAAVRQSGRRVVRAGTRRARYTEGKMRGLSHRLVPRRRPILDDITLAQKVRSEILGQGQFRSSDVHVDAYLGVVYLRGEISNEQLIDALVAAVARLHSVDKVVSYLHLPGRVAPNKANAVHALRA